MEQYILKNYEKLAEFTGKVKEGTLFLQSLVNPAIYAALVARVELGKPIAASIYALGIIPLPNTLMSVFRPA